MSREEFQDNCAGCRPALLDLETKKPLPPDSPEMQAINAVWETTTIEERQAYHHICCQNSRAPEDLRTVEPLIAKIQNALKP